MLTSELGAKGLALLHELVPGIATIGFLGNPNNPIFELTTRDVLAAASVIGAKGPDIESEPPTAKSTPPS